MVRFSFALAACAASVGVVHAAEDHAGHDHGGAEACVDVNLAFVDFLEHELEGHGARLLQGHDHDHEHEEPPEFLFCNDTVFTVHIDETNLTLPLSEYDVDSCLASPSAIRCERAACEDGELVIEVFDLCCAAVDAAATEPAPATECLAFEYMEHAEEEHAHVDGATWARGLGAAILASLASLIGIFIIICGGHRLNEAALTDASAFAIGVLLSAVFVHLLPETVEGRLMEWDTGASLLGGIVCALFISMGASMIGLGHQHSPSDLHPTEGASHRTGELDVEEAALKGKDGVELPHPINYSLVTNVIVGDGFHNLVDGMILGAAFSLCAESSIGWITLAAVLAHELPQELVDFVVLVRAGLSYKMALLANFGSSLMAVLGVVIVLAAGGSIDERAQGNMLAFGGGFLAFVALGELAPSVAGNDDPPKRKLLRMGLIILGAVLIGLLTLFHEHCHADHEEGAAGHDGHDH